MASRSEIINEVEGLETHCRAPIMPPEARTRWFQDWCADLGEFPVEYIRLAFRDWRQSGNAKFPTPGQIIPLIRAKVPGPKAERVELWREPTEDEYRAMTVREKIRHHVIMAAQAGTKAGPMWKNPLGGAKVERPVAGHVALKDMPPAYHHWKDVQARHEAEAGRLRKFLSEERRQEAA